MRRLVVAVLAFPLAVAAQTIERPTVNVGDECSFAVFDNLRTDGSGQPEKIAERRGVVTAVAENRVTYAWTQTILVSRDTEDLEDGTWVYDGDLNVAERNGRTFDPPYPARFFPIAPGTKWPGRKTNFQRQQRDGESTATLDGSVSDWGQITVPAGTFPALTVTWEGGYSTSQGLRRWGGRLFQQLAYSPRTACLVLGIYRQFGGKGQTVSDRTYKLTSHKP